MLSWTLSIKTDRQSKLGSSRSKRSAAKGQALAAKIVDTIRKVRNDETFSMFLQVLVRRKGTDFTEIEDPVLPRKRKVPRPFYGSTGLYFETPEDHYRNVFYEAYDNVIRGI